MAVRPTEERRLPRRHAAALMLALAGLAGPNEPRRSTAGALSAVSVVNPFVRPRKPQLELRSLGVGRLGDVETVAPAIAPGVQNRPNF